MIAPKAPAIAFAKSSLEAAARPRSSLSSSELPESKGARSFYAKGSAARAPASWNYLTEETETDLFGEQAVLCGRRQRIDKAGSRLL